MPSAIETSVRKGHLEVLEDPLVRTLLATKWSRFGRTTFLVQVGVGGVMRGVGWGGVGRSWVGVREWVGEGWGG